MRTPAVSPYFGATGLLILAALLFVLARFVPGDSFALGLFRAATEAALVGGLADWFAVVALFRHPLGLPIPHTAVIPANKERIATNLGRFVERNFLDPDLIGERLGRVRPTRHIGQWLAEARNADWLTGRLSDAIAVAFRGLQDDQFKRFLSGVLEHEMANLKLGPFLAGLLRLLRDSDRHHALFDEILDHAAAYISENEQAVLEVVETKTAWWVPKQVDRRVAAALASGLVDLMRDLKQRDHVVRARFATSFDRLLENLEADPELNAQMSEWVATWMKQPEFVGYARSLGATLRVRMEGDLAQTDSMIRKVLSETLRSFGRALESDADMQARFDQKIANAAKGLLVPWRREIGIFVGDVVRGWDARTLTDRLESAVGRDLQYIRINGTLVGALVGCVLYVLSQLMS